MNRTGLAIIAAAFASTAAAVLAAETTPLVTVDPATQARIGVATAPLAAEHRVPVVAGFARGLDPGPLAVLDGDIAVAAATAQASRAEAARARALNRADATVSTKAMEQAAAAAQADAAKLTLLRRRLGLEWGPAVQRLSDAARGRLVARLARGDAALIRIDLPGGAGADALSAQIDLGSAGTANAQILGPARTADPRLQTTGLLALVAGRQARLFGVGVAAPATLSAGSAAQGVVLPRSALLRSQGRTLVYVRKDATSFEQRRAEGGVPVPAGLFVAHGFAPGEAVVVQGASALNAAQHPAAAAE